MKLIRNAIETPDGTIIQSKHRHDYVTYVDSNGKEYMVDGGLEYLRRSAHEDQIDRSLYDNEPHTIQREILTWGSYGPNGDQPLKINLISEMSNNHIEAVLLNVSGTSEVIYRCMVQELKHRVILEEGGKTL